MNNLYLISRIPLCTCPDFIRGYLRKHLLFGIIRVVGVSKDAHVVYQKALLQTELADMFTSADSVEDELKATSM